MNLFDLKPLNVTQYKGENLEMSVKIQVDVQYSLIGSIKVPKGLKMWECNNVTGIVKLAKYKPKPYKFGESSNALGDLIINKDCIYLPALNYKAALKKFALGYAQNHYYSKEPILEF